MLWSEKLFIEQMTAAEISDKSATSHVALFGNVVAIFVLPFVTLSQSLLLSEILWSASARGLFIFQQTTQLPHSQPLSDSC